MDRAVRRRIAALVAVTALVGAAVAGRLLWPSEDAPARDADAAPGAASTTPSVSPTAEPAGETLCGSGAARPFTPARIEVPGVVDAEVVAVPRDSRGVTGVLPLSDKQRFAWDPPPGIRPGSDRGNVLVNTHTWADGTAAGNALLDGLHVGDRIVLRGDGHVQCYEVHERAEVEADARFPSYYDTDGRHQVAIVVCSGERTGPGEWTHRTLWFARAVGSGRG